MSDRYRVDMYTDAHNDYPSRTRIRPTIAGGIQKAIELARGDLATESGHVLVGTAGDSEIAEIYPEHGHGTVVISAE